VKTCVFHKSLISKKLVQKRRRIFRKNEYFFYASREMDTAALPVSGVYVKDHIITGIYHISTYCQALFHANQPAIRVPDPYSFSIFSMERKKMGTNAAGQASEDIRVEEFQILPLQ